ncbi:hypothetical protein ABTO85_19765, partial [Acinetobacter baumannii]
MLGAIAGFTLLPHHLLALLAIAALLIAQSIPPLSVTLVSLLVAIALETAESFQRRGLLPGVAFELVDETVSIFGPQLHAV